MDSDIKGGLSVAVFFAVLIGLVVFGWQWFKVFSAEQSGKAELAQAEFSRQIAVREAQAHLDSAKLLAGAEVERAKGVAEANKIIADGLKGHDEYLRYLWITNLEAGNNRETIYIPTEAGLPILEANRLK